MKKEFIIPNDLAKRPFTPVIKTTGMGSLITIAGQVARDIEGNPVGEGDIEKQMQQVFRNLKDALASAGATPKDIIKMRTYMVDIVRGVAAYRKARADFFGDLPFPPSTTLEVSRLVGPEYMVEIEVIAAIE